MMKKYIKLTISLLLIAFVYDSFVIPIHLVAGGTGGLGVIFNRILGVEPYIVIFFFSSVMFFLACLFLNTKDALATFYVILIYPFFIKFFSLLNVSVLFFDENILVLVLISAIIIGLLQGLIFKMDFNIGGLSVLAQIFNKYFKVSLTLANAVINGFIVLLGTAIFGISNLLYAIVFLIVSRFVSERVLLGSSRNKIFQIISSEYKIIEKFIEKKLVHDVTLYDTYGGYRKKKRKLIMTVIPNSDFIILKDFVKSVDKRAFIFVSDNYEVNRQDILIKKGVKR